MKILKPVYEFLFREHDIGFMRFCYAMLIPCAIWNQFCTVWMLFMAFILTLVTQAKNRGWDGEEQL